MKVRDHSHMTEKYGGSAHRVCKLNLSLNKKNTCCDSHLVFQEIGKYNFKINVISKTIVNM